MGGHPLFKPLASMDLEGRRYLVWKVAETEDRIPKLDDPGVRDRVVQVWKRVEARTQMLQRAKDLQAKAQQEAGKPLKEALAGQSGVEIARSEPFTWLTYGNIPANMAYMQPPRLSDVKGVEQPGNEFMRTVSELDPGQIGVAMNQPKTAAYVVRVVNFEPSSDKLWDEFKDQDFTTYAAVASGDRQAMLLAWIEQLRTDAGLTWTRASDETGSEPAPDYSGDF